MASKFIITLSDGTQHISHDDNWNELKSHAHFLAPHNKLPWVRYKLVDSNGSSVEVDFTTGTFRLNDGVVVHPGDPKYENALTFGKEPQNFPADEAWGILNSLPYFPIAGTRIFLSSDPTLNGRFELRLPFIGWKRKIGKRTIQKLAFIMPDGDIVLT